MANIVLPLVDILSKVNDNTNVLIEQDGVIQRVNVDKIAEIDSTKLFVTIDTQTMISSHSSIEIYAAIQAGKTVIISEQGAVYTVSEISEDKISIFIELAGFGILFYDIDINKTVILKNTITTATIPYSGSTTNGNILSVVDEKPTWTKFTGGIAVQTEAPENTNVLWLDTDDNSAVSGGNVELDTTLTKTGQAADAKVVGDRFAKLEKLINSSVSIKDDDLGNIVIDAITSSMSVQDDGYGNIIIS